MRPLTELGDVPVPLSLRAERVLLAAHQTPGVLDEEGELVQARPLVVGSTLELLDSPRGRGERVPCLARLVAAKTLLGAGEGVEQVELVRRPREPPLRELARERKQPLGRGDEVVPGDAPAPRIGARAAVRRHAAGDDEPGLVLRPELAERVEALLVEEALRNVELRFDVRLCAGRAHRRGVALPPEQKPDRLRDDRLPGTRLARQRDEARRELEIGLADEDEILDPQPAQHVKIVDRLPGRGTCPRRSRPAAERARVDSPRAPVAATSRSSPCNG
ncbi:MAG: hypothetical protein M5U27_02140 [Gaiella sp.]|nr:hypothetical protein [Gaiella sp.]